MLGKAIQPNNNNKIYTINKTHFEYIKRNIEIMDFNGNITFSRNGIEVPINWSENAIRILIQKYFRKTKVPIYTKPFNEKGIFKKFRRSVPDIEKSKLECFSCEVSAHQVFHRLAGCWTYWGIKCGYFTTSEEANTFYYRCYKGLYEQKFAPNSPQWFNTGLHWAYGIGEKITSQPLYNISPKTKEIVKSKLTYEFQQVHACFINSIEDDLVGEGGIMDLWTREATIFKYGSGAGSNFSKIRGKGEKLYGGGQSSGLMSFLSIGDRSAGSIKSGGTCLTAATPILTGRGFLPVKSLVNTQFTVFSYNILENKYVTKLASAFESGIKQCVRLTTANGSTFEVSYDHPFLTSDNEYVQAQYLKNKSVKTTFFENENHTEEEFTYFIEDVTKIDEQVVYDVQVKCSSPETKDKYDNHNFAIATLGTLLGTTNGHVTFVHNTRRAAKMVIVDIDHPEIEDFIDWKVKEENKVAALISGSKNNKKHIDKIVATLNGYDNFNDATDLEKNKDFKEALVAAEDANVPQQLIQKSLQLVEQGIFELDLDEFDSDWQSEAYLTVSGQNSNNSVSVPDNFMKAVDNDDDWNLINRTDRKVYKTIKAKTLWNKICMAAWQSADPGIQFVDTMNDYNTVINDELIRATNPCCFVGDTLVDTAEGRIRFDELEMMYRTGQKMPKTFSFSLNKQLPVLRQIRKVWVAGKTKKLIKITTDKGVELQCTPEHRFLLRSGEYVEARKLNIGDSLRKISRCDYGGRNAILHRCTKEHKRGTQYQSIWMWEQAFGDIPKGFDVHHINEDKYDDRLSNFELIERNKHKKLHSKGSMNGNYLHVSDKKLIEVADAIISGKPNQKNPDDPLTPNRWNNYIVRNDLLGIVPKAHSNGRIRGMEWEEFLQWIEENRDLVNDKVSKIEIIKLDTPVKVYDMEVDGTHNFAVVNSVDPLVNPIVVHNSEYVFLDDTACNLASLNLVRLYEEAEENIENSELLEDGNTKNEFIYNEFSNVLANYSQLVTEILDISIEMAQFVSPKIAEKTQRYRTVGLGYANLGSLLMRLGYAYGDENSINMTAGITGIMSANAYIKSAELANKLGHFPANVRNATNMKSVLKKHRNNLNKYDKNNELVDEAIQDFNEVLSYNRFRNAQVTVLAPTGTIGLVMDCDTTGIEPDFSLVKYKTLAGGGNMKIVNQSVEKALINLGYNYSQCLCIKEYIGGTLKFPNKFSYDTSTLDDIDETQYITKHDLLDAGIHEDEISNIHNKIENNELISMQSILNYMEDLDISEEVRFMFTNEEIVRNTEKYIFGHNTVEGCKVLEEEHHPVFNCAVAPLGYSNVITPEQHIAIMEAAQITLSGAISKTINMPANCTIEDISRIYKLAHDKGLKSVAIYRDGSKLSQPLMTGVLNKLKKIAKKIEQIDTVEKPIFNVNIVAGNGVRHKLPNKRGGYTQKMSVDQHKIYLRTGEYQNGKLGEIFLDTHKEGAAFRSLMNSFAIAVSIGLQYGVPLEEFFEAFYRTKFEPAGIVSGHDNIKTATSMLDLIFRDLAYNYLGMEDVVNVTTNNSNNDSTQVDLETHNTEVKTTVNKEGSVTIASNPYKDVEGTTNLKSNLYTGEVCRDCGSVKVIQTGTCATCQDCGSTTGC